MITALNLGVPDRVPTFELELQLTQELMGKSYLREEDLAGLPQHEAQRRLKENAAFLIELYETLDHDATCLHSLSTERIARATPSRGTIT